MRFRSTKSCNPRKSTAALTSSVLMSGEATWRGSPPLAVVRLQRKLRCDRSRARAYAGGKYIRDAEASGDQDVIGFFREIQEANRRRSERAKQPRAREGKWCMARRAFRHSLHRYNGSVPTFPGGRAA